MKISRQKIQALVRKFGYKFSISASTYIHSGGRDQDVQIEVSIGEQDDAVYRFNQLSDIGAMVEDLGGDVRILSNKYTVKLIVNNSGALMDDNMKKFNRKTFVSIQCANHITAHKNRQEEKRNQADERNRAYEESLDKKKKKAMQLNPNITWQLLSGDKEIGNILSNVEGSSQVFHLLIGYSKESDGYRARVTYTTFSKEKGVGSGSTSGNGFSSIEEIIIHFLASWAIH